jgi:light-regulated signal transduction histidine kinase (bacteriophytochrome)
VANNDFPAAGVNDTANCTGRDQTLKEKIQGLREPLSVIHNSAFFLSMRFKTKDEKDRKHIEIIKKELKRALALIDDLLLKWTDPVNSRDDSTAMSMRS